MRDEANNRFQIMVLQHVSLWFGIGILCVACYRLLTQHYLLAAVQTFFALFLLINYRILTHDPSYYKKYAVLFFIALFTYMIIAFFSADNNRLNIIWIVISPLFIFFFLDTKGGIVIYGLLLTFIGWLIATRYPYNAIEYITLIAAVTTVAFLMYGYERYKDAYVHQLQAFNTQLKEEIAKQTRALQTINHELEERVLREVEQRSRHEKMLLRQHRMASMGEMLDAIAHQWRQPLMGVSAQLLHVHRFVSQHGDQEVRRRLDHTFELLEHMSRTIDDFRNLLHRERCIDTWSIRHAVAEVLTLLQSRLASVRVITKIPDNIRWHGCKSELQQVLIIIVTNALEALHIRRTTHPKLIIQCTEDNRMVRLRIIDNAGGIDPTILPHVFDPYMTTKREQGGTGLGLYIANLLVCDYMHGRVEAHNHRSGAILTIHLPKGATDA